MAQPNGSYAVMGRLPKNPKVWDLAPHEKVEINFLAGGGQERRLIVDDILLCSNEFQPLVVRGRCELDGYIKDVELKYRDDRWWIYLDDAVIAPARQTQPQSIWAFSLRYLHLYRGLMIAAVVVLGALLAVHQLTYRQFFLETTLAGIAYMVPHIMAWYQVRYDLDKRREFAHFSRRGLMLAVLPLVCILISPWFGIRLDSW